MNAWDSAGIGVHAFFDPDYPSRLRSIHQTPPVLFSRGTLRADHRAIAVAGTRQASERGLGIASAVATDLARNGVTVVSGLAKGIDTAAHRAALDADGRTVAVIGTGINQFYPAQNRALQERISCDGLVISQFWPDTPPHQRNFPMRNAVMSGYAAATVVVEAPWKSGARIQARLALEHGRPVIMPDQLLEHDWARDYAKKPGVHVVASLGELLDVVEGLISELSTGPDSLPEIPTDHHPCAAKAAHVDRWSHVAVVPSTRGRSGEHPLRLLIGNRLRLPWVRLTANSALPPDLRSFHRERFSVPDPPDGFPGAVCCSSTTPGRREPASSPPRTLSSRQERNA
ncbi:DNA-protecting protein DprA [Microbispora hainanensis]|uniref:DNA-processing protein DprA n=1 Tax=Microbispora hainanensis TaxID=568844 RepID=UPI002E27E405|nr:DNA-processing protein DprA [Microbispora hainanensis]